MWKLLRRSANRSHFSTQPNYFKLFNLPHDFTEQQLKSSYLQLVKKYHPDLSQDPSTDQIFKQVQIGYEVLSDQSKRKQHQTEQKQTMENMQTTDEHIKAIVDEIKGRFYTNFQRKDPINDEFNFTYKMFKEHYEKVEAPKAQYQRYEGQGNNEYYAKKNEKGEHIWKQMAAGASALAVVALAVAYTHS